MSEKIDLIEIICITCGQSPVSGAPRHIGEWNDAGHEDSAHAPNWSQESFPGSIWAAHPTRARWYGEVIGSAPGEDIDYVYGYADCEAKPSIRELIPKGWRNTQSTIKPTPNNPLWKPPKRGASED
jgi:hypothetical protein